MSEGFVPHPGLDRPDPFQPMICFCLEGSSWIMAGVNQQSTRQESTIQNPTNTQVSGFVKNGKLDIDACFKEVNRRASEIGCENFECSFERN